MAAPVEAGQILAGKYRVEKVLGEGGMGLVVAAIDTALERRVAIKFLLPQYAQHPEASTRFMREARAAVKIQSEHIARVIDVSSLENGAPYMVMEHLSGGDLSQVLKQRGALPIDTAVGYVLQASDAIAEAHAYGIVHRDLKPANLFLANQPDGTVKIKVLDFGISKNVVGAVDGTDASLTRTSSMMGSPLYMSPEQMRSSRDVDQRTDIWALGVILYELLTDRLPFDASSIPELSAKILLDEPDPLARTDVPKELERIVMRALEKNPGARFPSVAEFAIALSPFTSKRARANVERISKLLASAGLSSAAVTVDESMPPPAGAAVLEDTVIDAANTNSRSHGGTLSEWGKTNGALVPSKKRSPLPWALAGAGSLLVVGAAWLLLGKDDEAAVGASPTLGGTDVKSAPSDDTQERRVSADEGGAAEAASTGGTPPPNASAVVASAPSEAATVVASLVPVVSAAAPGTPPPGVAQSRPKVTKKAPVARTPTDDSPPTKPGSGSLKDQFGGRK